jgi:hypothetical protein
MKKAPEQKAEELLSSLDKWTAPELSPGLEERTWRRIIAQKQKPAGVISMLAPHAGALLAAASVAALINIAYLLYTSSNRSNEKQAAEIFIDSYQLDEMNTNL